MILLLIIGVIMFIGLMIVAVKISLNSLVDELDDEEEDEMDNKE